MKKFKIDFFHYSSSSILLSWPNIISIEISNDIHNFIKHISNEKNILEIIKGYSSVLVQYRNDIADFDLSCDSLNKTYNESLKQNSEKKIIWEIPVCYESDFAKDIKVYSEKVLLSREQVINLHSSNIYYLHMYGFIPGFMYLGGLNKKLSITRKKIPDRKILKGSVAIGGGQTGVYPADSPGGWYVIGNTPINLFNLNNNSSPVNIPVGDYVQFKSISSVEYYDIKKKVEKDKYQFVKKYNHD